MENASKALLIAGGILISMLVISIGVYLFANYRNVATSHEQTMQASQIQKLNSNFLKFEGRKDITIQEIVTLASFAKQYKEQTEIHIQVNFNGQDLTVETVDFIGLIKENSTEDNGTNKYFKCGVNPAMKDIEYDENGIVKSIRFY